MHCMLTLFIMNLVHKINKWNMNVVFFFAICIGHFNEYTWSWYLYSVLWWLMLYFYSFIYCLCDGAYCKKIKLMTSNTKIPPDVVEVSTRKKRNLAPSLAIPYCIIHLILQQKLIEINSLSSSLVSFCFLSSYLF